MAQKVTPGPISEETSVREAVCVHTSKIYDSCRDKDCVEDLKVYPTTESQEVIDNAVSIRARGAELLYVGINVEEVTFNRGCYTIDIRYYYKVTGDAYTIANRYSPVTGLSVFDKRVILFGSEGSAKVFSSNTVLGALDRESLRSSNLPTAVVEAVDPIVLNMKLVDICEGPDYPETEVIDIPEVIASEFDSPIVFTGGERRVLTSLGQFSIVRLERDSQLLIPTYDYCMPDKECIGSNDDDPCTLFGRIDFPIDEFFPPDSISQPECYREVIENAQR